ncbi:MAG: cytochrome c3 family protein [Fibrobacterota bacterium]
MNLLTLLLLIPAVTCLAVAPAIHKPSADIVVITKSDAFVTPADSVAGVVKTGNSADPVRMSHRAHALSGAACVTCHHKKGNDARIKQCAQCHKGEKAHELMHGQCIGCHTQQKKGPLEDQCEACHQPPKK